MFACDLNRRLVGFAEAPATAVAMLAMMHTRRRSLTMLLEVYCICCGRGAGGGEGAGDMSGVKARTGGAVSFVGVGMGAR